MIHPIETAPDDREILVYNPFEGWYRSHKTKQKGSLPGCCWPLYRSLNGDENLGTWWPVPTHWKELHEDAPDQTRQQANEILDTIDPSWGDDGSGPDDGRQ